LFSSIEEVADVNPRVDKSAIPDDLPVSFVPMPAVGAGDGSIRVEETRPAGEVKKGFTAFLEGDVLFAKITPCMENGKMAVVPKLVNGYGFGSTEFHVLRPKPGLDAKYLYYFVSSHRFRTEAERNMTGAVGQRRVPTAYLKECRIPVAPLDQQKRIVAEIEKQFSRLDEAVVGLKRVKANLKRYKAAVLKAAVEGRLVETEAEFARREDRSYETGEQLLQRILETRRSQWQGKGKYKEPAAPDTTGLPELPGGWVWASVDQLASPEPNSITDGPFGSNLKTEHYQETGPRVIRLQNIKDGEFADEYAHISPAHFVRLRKHAIHAGDLVIASLGDNPPRACIIPSFVGPAIVKADCMRFKPHSALTAAYLNAALNCQPTRQRVKNVLHGIGRPRLSLGEIREIALPIPPETEQHRIVAEIDRRTSLVRETEIQVDANLQRADRLRQSTLARAFTSG
jgi:type I restriction enzyme S subunit